MWLYRSKTQAAQQNINGNGERRSRQKLYEYIRAGTFTRTAAPFTLYVPLDSVWAGAEWKIHMTDSPPCPWQMEISGWGVVWMHERLGAPNSNPQRHQIQKWKKNGPWVHMMFYGMLRPLNRKLYWYLKQHCATFQALKHEGRPCCYL